MTMGNAQSQSELVLEERARTPTSFQKLLEAPAVVSGSHQLLGDAETRTLGGPRDLSRNAPWHPGCFPGLQSRAPVSWQDSRCQGAPAAAAFCVLPWRSFTFLQAVRQENPKCARPMAAEKRPPLLYRADQEPCGAAECAANAGFRSHAAQREEPGLLAAAPLCHWAVAGGRWFLGVRRRGRLPVCRAQHGAAYRPP